MAAKSLLGNFNKSQSMIGLKQPPQRYSAIPTGVNAANQPASRPAFRGANIQKPVPPAMGFTEFDPASFSTEFTS